MGIQSIFTESSKTERPVYRYGMLVFIFVLFAWEIKLYLTLPPSYDGDPYGGFIVVIMLLLIHLACAFKWPKRLNAALIILVWSWLVFGLFYIIYLSHALHPSSPSPFPW